MSRKIRNPEWWACALWKRKHLTVYELSHPPHYTSPFLLLHCSEESGMMMKSWLECLLAHGGSALLKCWILPRAKSMLPNPSWLMGSGMSSGKDCSEVKSEINKVWNLRSLQLIGKLKSIDYVDLKFFPFTLTYPSLLSHLKKPLLQVSSKQPQTEKNNTIFLANRHSLFTVI